jgi:hypothetical protein
MRITEGGSVGIGTTSPGYKLDVVASSNSDGFRVRQGATSKFILNGDGELSWGQAADYGALTWDTGMAIVAGESSNDLKLVAGTAYVYLKDSTGNVGVGTTSPAYKLEVSGSFAATTKSFVINHPTKSGMKLQYGSLESPYHGVRLTGEGKVVNGKCTIKLPDYVHGLVKQEGSQVQITNIKHGKVIWVEDIDVKNDQFTLKCDIGTIESNNEYNFYWSFTAIRKDIKDLEVEI